MRGTLSLPEKSVLWQGMQPFCRTHASANPGMTSYDFRYWKERRDEEQSSFLKIWIASRSNDDAAPLPRGDLRLAVGDAIDRAVIVIGDQQRTVFHLQHIDRPAQIAVVFQEAGDERLRGFDRAVLVQLDDDDIAAKFLGPVPRTVPCHDDGVLVALREQVSGGEPHPGRPGVRAR